MSFKWVQYLQLAELLNESDSEAAKRAAISRAYYAVFCICRNFAHSKKELIPGGTADDHNLVIRHFEASPDTNRQLIGDLLRRMRNDRNSADYDDELTGFAERMAKDSIKSAHKILEIIKIL
jgi:uncharacterized protein (UPF0332 family)